MGEAVVVSLGERGACWHRATAASVSLRPTSKCKVGSARVIPWWQASASRCREVKACGKRCVSGSQSGAATVMKSGNGAVSSRGCGASFPPDDNWH